MLRAYIRGIYTTALSKLVLDSGGALYNPSQITRKRFGNPREATDFNISITDRNSLQGVRGFGEAEAVEEFRRLLFNTLPDVVFWVRGRLERLTMFKVEFPALSKRKLDEIRAEVCETVPGHHYAKVYGPPLSELAEKAEATGRYDEFIEALNSVKPAGKVEMVHVKLGGEVLSLGIAEVLQKDWPIRLRRVAKTSGMYDGLNVEKEAGDEMLTEIDKGAFHYITTYISRGGEVKGYYANICTPVEVYGEKIRYVDLEVDVVTEATGLPRIVDEDLLERAFRESRIPETLFRRAKEEAELMAGRLAMKVLK